MTLENGLQITSKLVNSPGIRLNEAQAVQSQWAEALGVNGTPAQALGRAAEEFYELAELLIAKNPEDFDRLCAQDPDFRNRVLEETADVLVVTLNFCTAMNVDAENLFLERLARNHAKYPPAEIQGWIKDQGIDLIAALKKAKDRWNGNH